MANILTDLTVKKIAFVEEGDNPEANILMFKRKEPTFDSGSTDNFVKKICTAVVEAIMKISGGGEAVKKQNDVLVASNRKGDTENMNIDKSKMTPEEKVVFENFEKKYGMAETRTIEESDMPDSAGEPIAEKSTPALNLHPEVKKALADFEEFKKAKDAEIAELKKSLEIEKLTAFAKKYEVIGKKSDELANKLYEMKKAGGTVYNDYVALLDENLNTVEKSGLFAEIGSNMSGSAGVTDKIGIAAAEIRKSADGVSSYASIVKAWEDNPELALEYEREYMGGAR